LRCAGLATYGWAAHDGETFGRQELADGRLTTSFAKRFCAGCPGGDWALRLAARAGGPGADPEGRSAGDGGAARAPSRASLIVYIADEEVRLSQRMAPRDAVIMLVLWHGTRVCKPY
jgi:hypothetical protein